MNDTFLSTTLAVLLSGLSSASAVAAPVPITDRPDSHTPYFANQTYAAELKNVRAGSYNGKDYLTIEIDRDVGPVTCFGTTLLIDTDTVEGGLERQQQMEYIALEAVVSKKPVVITVPLALDQCVDGLPKIADIEPIAAN